MYIDFHTNVASKYQAFAIELKQQICSTLLLNKMKFHYDGKIGAEPIYQV